MLPFLPPAAMVVLSGLHATETTPPVPGSGRADLSFPVATSHRYVWPLWSPATRSLPSGLNATDMTPLAPGSGRVDFSFRVATSHRYVAPLPSPTARILSSGLNATEFPLGARAGEGEDQLPGGDIPQVRSAVAVADGQELAVMGERDRIRAGAVGVDERCSLAAGGDIPQVRMAVAVADGQELAVRAERERIRARATEGAGGAEGHRWYGAAGPGEREIDSNTHIARGGLHQVDDLNAAAGFGDDDLVVDGAAGQRDGQARLRAGAGRGHGPGAGRDGHLRTHGAGRRIGGDVTGGSRRATAVERHLALIEVGLDHPHQGFTRRCGQVVVDHLELPLLGGSPERRHCIRATSMHGE